MNITALTAPTRGPDYSAPTASSGTPSVTAPQPTSAVAAESPSTAMTYVADSTAEVARRKKLAPATKVTTPRYLTATRRASLPLLLERPTNHVSPHQAAQAYQAQRHAEDVAAQLAAQGALERSAPFTVNITEERAPPATVSDQPPPSSLHTSSEATSVGGLDMMV